MVVAVASEGLTLLNGSIFINRSVQMQAQAMLIHEQRLVRIMIEQGSAAGTARRQVATLAQGFAGRLAYLPTEANGQIIAGPFSDLLPHALARQIFARQQPVFRERLINGQPWFALYVPCGYAAHDSAAASARFTGLLLLAIPAKPLEAEAKRVRDGLIGTALLTLILLGYALFGASPWLGMPIEGREVRLATAKGELELALSHMSDGLCVFDQNNRVTIFNQQLSEIMELPAGAVRRGISYSELLALSVAAGNHPGRNAAEVIADRPPFTDAGGSLKRQHKTRNGRTIEVVYCPTVEGGWLVTCADITERLRAQEQIAHMAEHDSLTGLLNRASFAARLAKEVVHATEERPLALLYLDLDHFKEVNDSWGHPAGDQLLRTVAERLRQSMRKNDYAAYRLGGDEFAVLLPGISVAEAHRLARRVLRVINQSCEIAGQPYRLRVSVGLAVAPSDAADPERLISCADLALYAAKTSGRNAIQSFGPEMEHRLLGSATMKRELQVALAEHQFVLWYQPIWALPSRELVRFEALLRWNHPQRGMILPAEFIGLAEETELIDEIGAWVLTEACAEAAGWPEAIGVAVNLSAQQLRNPDLVVQIEHGLHQAGIAAKRLELEVTETAVIRDPDMAFAQLRDIQRYGVQIALDDFGIGYSSLSFLAQFKFDTIKIDRSFVSDIVNRPECAAIVDAVSSLGTHLGSVTTAEGIETEEQLRRVVELGCCQAQGFLFGQPMPAEAARKNAWSTVINCTNLRPLDLSPTDNL